MYVHYVKDCTTGRIVGAVVATAINRIGFALAKPKGNISKDVKAELVTVAAARSIMHNFPENNLMLQGMLERGTSHSPSNLEYKHKVSLVQNAMAEMAHKASQSWSLPYLEKNKRSLSK